MTANVPTSRPAAAARLIAARLSPRASYRLIAAFIFLLFCASNIIVPFYGTYQERWGFGGFALTGIFAAYAAGVLATLLLVGGLSDARGRRPVLLAASGVLLLSCAVFAAARGIEWLVAGRFLLGLGVGAASGTASAALTDLEPTRDPRRAALLNTVCFATGSALGPLLGGLLLEYAPAPTVVPFVALLAGFVACLAGIAIMPEPLAAPSGAGWQPRRPGVSRALRPVFLAAAAGIVAAWSVGSLFQSLGATIAHEQLRMANHVLGGLLYFLVALTGGLAQIACRGWQARRAQLCGAAALAVGMATVVAAAILGATPPFLGGVIMTGLGFGLAFMGSMRALATATPAGERAATVSAYYSVGYLALIIPALLGGRLLDASGLHRTLTLFGGATVAMALLAGLAAARLTPPETAG
jgi:MFS family permease